MITATTDPTKQRYNSGILKDTIPKIDQCIVAKSIVYKFFKAIDQAQGQLKLKDMTETINLSFFK